MKIVAGANHDFRINALRQSRVWQIESALRIGNVEEAATTARELVAKPAFGRTIDQFDVNESLARTKVRLGQALAASGRRNEALGVLQEAETYYRRQLAQGATDVGFRLDFSRALYQLAVAQTDDGEGRTRRIALLDEAAALLGGLTFEAQQLRASKELIAWVSTARAQAVN